MASRIAVQAAALCVLVTGTGFATEMGLEGLIRNSPFSETNSHDRNGPGSDSPLEFRGFVVEDSAAIYSIYEAATHHSYWVRENQEMGQFTITHFDEGAATISVDYHGRPLKLALKRASVVLLHTPGPGSVPVGSVPQDRSSVAAADPDNNPEAQLRLEQVREEIRRRRAMMRPNQSFSGPVPASRP